MLINPWLNCPLKRSVILTNIDLFSRLTNNYAEVFYFFFFVFWGNRIFFDILNEKFQLWNSMKTNLKVFAFKDMRSLIEFSKRKLQFDFSLTYFLEQDIFIILEYIRENSSHLFDLSWAIFH